MQAEQDGIPMTTMLDALITGLSNVGAGAALLIVCWLAVERWPWLDARPKNRKEPK